MRVAKSSQPKDQESVARTSVAESHRGPFYVPMLNPLMKSFLHLGVPVGPMTLLTIRGRKTGRMYSTPVGLFRLEGHRYVFDTFGNADWVRNLRAAGEAKIGRGWRWKHVTNRTQQGRSRFSAQRNICTVHRITHTILISQNGIQFHQK